MADLTAEQILANELARADRAKELLDNPLLKSAFDDLEAALLKAKEVTTDEKQIMQLHLMFVCNRKIQNLLRAHIDTGKLAAIQLEEKRKFKLWRTN